MKAGQSTRYSEAFKVQVVSEIESGKYNGAWQATKAYGIPGSLTVSKWLRRYGRRDLMPKQVTISTMQEQDEKKALQKRVRELEKALSTTHMKELLGETYLEIACERIGVNVEEFKKKADMKLSSEAGSKGKQPR